VGGGEGSRTGMNLEAYFRAAICHSCSPALLNVRREIKGVIDRRRGPLAQPKNSCRNRSGLVEEACCQCTLPLQ
jgi:hypothetical protein